MAVNTVDIVMRIVDQVTGRMNRINQALAQTNQAGQQLNTTTQALQAGLAGLTVAAVYQGLKQVATAMIDISEAGAQYLRVAESFQAQTTTMGEQYVEVLGTMRRAARGTADDMELMLSANKAFSLGVAQTGVEVAKLIETSTVLGRRTGLGQEQALERLMVGIGRLSPRILDDLGIAVNLTQLYQDATGKASSELSQAVKIQTLLNHVLQEGETILKQYPDGLEDTASGFERLSAQWTNFKNNLGNTAPFEALANIIGRLADGMQDDQMFAGALEGTLSVAEYDAVIASIKEYDALMQKRRDNMPAGGLLRAMLDAYDFSDSKLGKELVVIEENARRAALQLDELITKQEMIGSVKAGNEVDFAAEMERRGQQVLDMFAELQGARERYSEAAAGGGTALERNYLEALTDQLVRIAFEYNKAAEEMDEDLIDIPALREALLQVEDGEDIFNVFAEAIGIAKAETDAETEALERMAIALGEASDAYQDIIGAKRDALGGDIIDLLSSDSSPEAYAAADQARKAMEQQMYKLAQAGMTEEEQIIATNRAYNAGVGVIEKYVEAKEKAEGDRATFNLEVSGNRILSILPQISQGLYDLQEGGAGAIQAAVDVDRLRGELDNLVATYNKAAAFLGVELIDIDNARNGALAVGQAADQLGIFNSTNSMVATYAQLAGNALTQEQAALGLFEGAVAGAKANLMARLGNLIGDFSPEQLAQMYTEGAAEIDEANEGIFNSEDNLIKKYFDVLAVQEDVAGGYEAQAEAMRNAGKEAEDLAETIENKLKSAYDSLNSVVSGELMDSLNELSNVGIGEKDFAEFGVREDVPAENARRLAALMKEGVKDQPWLEEFKQEAPAIWDEYINAADPAAAAARMLQEFEKGLRPELIDFGQLKQQIKDNIETSMRLEGMGRQLTDELIAEMGEGEGDTIKKFVADALGIGFDESGFGTDSAAKLLATLTSEDMKLKMIDAGAVNAMNWASGFSETMPEHMQPFIDLLVSYVTPAVEARLNQKTNATKAK